MVDVMTGFGERREQGLVQAFVPEAAVEALNKTVWHRLGGGNVMPSNFRLLVPFESGRTGQFSAIIRHNCLWFAASGDDSVKLPGNTCTGQ